MKRIKFKPFLILFFITFILWVFSCKKEDPISLIITPASIEFGAEGGAINVTITCNSDWIINNASDWCTESFKSGTGNAVISFTAQTNEDTTERATLIIVTAGDITEELQVLQKGGQFFTFHLSTDSIEFDINGGTSKIQVTSDIEWQITNTSDWLTESIQSSDNSSTVILTAHANEDTLERSTSLLFIAGNITKEVVVTQIGLFLTISNSSVEFGALGGTQNIDISSNLEWSINNSSDWCEVSEQTIDGNKTLQITVNSNINVGGDAEDRSTTVVISTNVLTRNVSVTQNGFVFEIAPDNTKMRDLTCVELSEKMGVGWNVGNSLEATGGETSWGNPLINQRLIDSVEAAGFNAIRIPVAWSSHFSNNETFIIETSFLERVEEVVNYVLNNDMYAIINIHWDGGWMQPTFDDEEYVNNRLAIMWKQIATHFRDYNDHLLFAGTNEVMVEGDYGTPSTEYYTVQNGFNQTFVETVRATGGRNAYRHIVVQGFNTNIDYTDRFNEVPIDVIENRLMMEVHYYDPYDFALNENSNVTQWGENADASETAGWGNEDHADEQFNKMKTKFIDNGVAVILGEYGAIYRSEESEPYREYFNEYITKSIIDHGLVPFYWDNGYTGNRGFGIFNRETGEQVYPNIINAIASAVE
ncbi:cellulase family glycosylhydrolase [Bacteroidota bacterium]